MARKSKAEAEKTRETILAAARATFCKHGYADTRIADIIADTGITKGALFHHFGSKEALFRSVWESLQREMDEESRKAAEDARSRDDPYAAFLAGCAVYLIWAARKEYAQIVLIDGPSVLGLAEWYEADNDLGRQNMHSGIQYLAKLGIVKANRVEALSVLVHNALNGAGFAISRGDPDLTPHVLLDALEAMIKSLR